MATPATGTWLLALQAALAARPGLSGVSVWIVQPDVTGDDAIVLVRPSEGGVTRNVEWAAVGQRRTRHNWAFPGRIMSYRTADAAGSTAAADLVAEAWDRCDAILDEVADEIKSPPTMADQTINALITDISVQPSPHDRGGWAVWTDFTLTVEARSS